MERRERGMSISKFCESRVAALSAEGAGPRIQEQQVVCDTCDVWTPVYTAATWTDS